MISFFCDPSYLGNRFPKHTNELHTFRLSSRVRGEEIVEYLGGRFNPTQGSENDVRIHVKPYRSYAFARIKDGDFVDFLDSQGGCVDFLKHRPKVKIIAASQRSYDFLRENMPNETIIFIPSHHINIERLRRNRKKMTTAGFIGSPSPQTSKEYEDIRLALKKIGVDLITCFNYKTREDAINLYKQTDIFVIGYCGGGDVPHKIPTKIINATSFGIPTVAYPLQGYQEIEGHYVPVHNISEMIAEVEKFKDPDYYALWPDKLIDMSEKYHISKVADLYRKLEQ